MHLADLVLGDVELARLLHQDVLRLLQELQRLILQLVIAEHFGDLLVQVRDVVPQRLALFEPHIVYHFALFPRASNLP